MPYGETWKCWDCSAGLQSSAVHRSKQPLGYSAPFKLPATPKFTKIPGCIFRWLSGGSRQSVIQRLHTWFNLWKKLWPFCPHIFLILDLRFSYNRANMGSDSCLTVRSAVQQVRLLLILLDSASAVFWYTWNEAIGSVLMLLTESSVTSQVNTHMRYNAEGFLVESLIWTLFTQTSLLKDTCGVVLVSRQWGKVLISISCVHLSDVCSKSGSFLCFILFYYSGKRKRVSLSHSHWISPLPDFNSLSPPCPHAHSHSFFC